jgi:hypothetical protein
MAPIISFPGAFILVASNGLDCFELIFEPGLPQNRIRYSIDPHGSFHQSSHDAFDQNRIPEKEKSGESIYAVAEIGRVHNRRGQRLNQLHSGLSLDVERLFQHCDGHGITRGGLIDCGRNASAADIHLRLLVRTRRLTTVLAKTEAFFHCLSDEIQSFRAR